eukprot:scaffold198080_cov35-Tisochrysis_lutea.AAC.3
MRFSKNETPSTFVASLDNVCLEALDGMAAMLCGHGASGQTRLNPVARKTDETADHCPATVGPECPNSRA